MISDRALRLFVVALLVATALPCSAQRQAVEAERAMVVSAHELATQAGVEILKKGGNSIDAAVATGFAMAVTFPFAGNIGGGGFMLIHLADGRDLVIDYRETAPAAATRDMYLDGEGNVLKGPGSSTVGWRASGVPGTVAGFALAHQSYGSGRVKWAELLEPARRLAADGHVVSQETAERFQKEVKLLEQFEETKRIYLKNGTLWKPGELWKQPELAATLVRLQKHGPEEFYTGETARRIEEAMLKNNGTITRVDLKAYKPVEREPLRGTYRGHEIVTLPPPSSGGIALLQMLAMLEPFEVAPLGHNSAAKYHLFVEVMRRAFRDRAEYLGDPDFVKVPVEELLDRSYTARLMENFDPAKATPNEALPPGNPAAAEPQDTTHFSIIDAAGNAVSNTYTLNGAFGSGVTIPGTGILMNNEMDDFTAKVGVKNLFGLLQGPLNAIQPGKRPLSSMTSTFVFKDGKLLLITGSPGGPTIINTVLQVITNMIDHGMPVMAAVEAPRIHHQWMPDEMTHERYGISPDTAEKLREAGHTVRERTSYEGANQGDAETIAIDPQTGRRLGASDPRKQDARAIGY
ncbi:gamma-glutamyltransferase [soil metagenome]